MIRKRNTTAMLPVCEWLETKEAANYLRISVSYFDEIKHSFTVSKMGKTHLYKVAELKKFIEQNIIA